MAVFAAAVITYAVVKVNEANADKVDLHRRHRRPEDVRLRRRPGARRHRRWTTRSRPPVGGAARPAYWADCTGTVYTVDIRHENAVHSLEHGAVWITYNPDEVSQADVARSPTLVESSPAG